MRDTLFVFVQDSKEKSKAKTGIKGLTHGRRDKRPRLDDKPKKADVLITVKGITFLAPANLFFKNGLPKKELREDIKLLRAYL